MQQKGRTLDFWDDFYRQESDESGKEWILQPSEELFRILTRHGACLSRVEGNDKTTQHGSGTSVSFLEIGCGTSTLAREFYRYLTMHATDEHRCAVEAVASDVSAICIEKNRQRDEYFLREEAGGSFQYSVLNILDDPVPPPLLSRFDLILDKGCLDTFLFRTRHRGGRRKEALMKLVLDNLYTMLNDRPHSCLLILSPRSSARQVREHGGFVCDKHELDPSALRRGELDGDKLQDRDALYLYVCRRLPGYQVSSPLAPQRVGVLSDDDSCPSCGLTFKAFRGGHQSLNGRGYHVWYREWTGHLTHCKGRGE